MIKNIGLTLLLLLAVAACRKNEPESEGFQGVIEFDERLLGFEVGGRVRELTVQRGDRLEKDALVAVIDSGLEQAAKAAREGEARAAEEQAALLRAGTRAEDIRGLAQQIKAAKAGESLLVKNLDRERALLEQGVTTRAAVDELETRLETSRAEIAALGEKLTALKRGARPEEIASAEARATAANEAVRLEAERLARHELRSPDDGTVLDVHIERGEVVTPGTPVVTMGDTRHPFADVFVPQAELEGIDVGTKASVKVDSTADVFSGRVEYVSRRTEFTPRFLFSERERPNLVIRVRVRIDDPNERLHAGVPTRVTLKGGGGAVAEKRP